MSQQRQESRLGVVITLSVCAWAGLARADVEGAPEMSATLSSVPESPYRYALTVDASNATEFVADRRLLELTFRPRGSRRAYRCRHPSRPRVVEPARVRSGPERVWSEWFDLRMLCWAHRRHLSDGGTLEGSYGFRRGGRRRWIGRRDGSSTVVAELPAFEVPPTATSPETAAALTVTLRDVDSPRGDGVAFRVSLRGGDASSTRVYLRDDLVSFLVRGPLSVASCEVEVESVVPIVDFYRVVDRRSAVRTDIAAARWCPPGTFDTAGIYEVTPSVDLVYDGSRYSLEAATGRFAGGIALVRVRSGGEEYVEHELPLAPSEAEAETRR